jgi:hypothetical protein
MMMMMMMMIIIIIIIIKYSGKIWVMVEGTLS